MTETPIEPTSVSNERADENRPSRERKPKERQKPFAIRQAEIDIEKAEQSLAEAKESKSASRIKTAEDNLKEKRKVLADLKKGNAPKRRKTRREQTAEYYERLGPYIVGLVRNVPELREAVQEAIANNWNIDKFLRDRRVIDWLATKGTSAKEAIALEFDPARKKEWEDKLSEARVAVKDLAIQTYNLNLTDEMLDRLARRYVYEGWDKNPRGLESWMADRVRRGGERTETLTGGTIESNERDLRDLARRFGVSETDDWFRDQATNLLDPESGVTREKLVNDMIRYAESLFPVFAGQLSERYTVRDAASPYLAQLSRWLEIDDEQIDLSDELLNKAFQTQQDEKGQPKPMSLWEFQKEIRKDERWQSTDNAITAYTDFGERMLKMFGFRG
jgi:hypothetical protein